MSLDIETNYREHLADSPASTLLMDTLDRLVSLDPSADNPSSKLARDMNFAAIQIGDRFIAPFAQTFPFMVDHAVQQDALMLGVLADDEISGDIPNFVDPLLLARSAFIADTGLGLVPFGIVRQVHEHGLTRELAKIYNQHPRHTYNLAQAHGTPDASTQAMAAFGAHHHWIQANNPYGLSWRRIVHDRINPVHIDLRVLIQRPFDYIDDKLTQQCDGSKSLEELVDFPVDKFIRTYPSLLNSQPDLVAAMHANGFDPNLPVRLALKTREHILGETAIGAVYKQHWLATAVAS